MSDKESACIKLAVRFVLGNNYIHLMASYKHIKGLAMGTPLAPPIANIFMAFLEKKTFSCRPGLCPLIYVRFLDNVLVSSHGEHPMCPLIYVRFLDNVLVFQVMGNIPCGVLRKR